MKTLRYVTCSLVLAGGILGAGSTAKADGLVGFYVYRHWNGLIISSFIPGSSADQLHRQGELYTGDIITRYDGRRVYSAQQVINISNSHPPGTWMKMEFRTPQGLPFWHWVQPGGGAAACVQGPSGPAPCKAFAFKRGSGRPGSGRPSSSGLGRPGRPPYGPGRPR